MKQRKFTLEDEIIFSSLSGDYNPIHIDPIMARRYMFGQPIVHGLHVVLWVLDIWFKEKNNSTKLISLKVSFPKPIFLEKLVDLKIIYQDSDRVEIEIIQEKVLCTKVSLEVEEKQADNQTHINSSLIIDEMPKKRSPNNPSIENIIGMAGDLELYLNRAIFSRLFPSIYKSVDYYIVASLLSTTRLVGMDCPGLNSLISNLQFSFKNSPRSDGQLSYTVSKVDKRFGLVVIKLEGESLQGVVKTFLRPAPIHQMNYISVKSHVKHDEFKGQNALVIGGSRGIGEVTAKILAAGGADVRITYNKGEHEATHVVNEILLNNGKAEKIRLNVVNEESFSSILSGNWSPTHCYYYATPFIFSGNKGVFSQALLEDFNAVYVSAFFNLVRFLKNYGVLNYFYPSTTAIEELPENMIEYTISKYSAKKARDFLISIYSPINIEMPKFPRMATDQTVSFLPVNNQDPVILTLSYLRAFNASSII